jgi:hypothetical protein
VEEKGEERGHQRALLLGDGGTTQGEEGHRVLLRFFGGREREGVRRGAVPACFRAWCFELAAVTEASPHGCMPSGRSGLGRGTMAPGLTGEDWRGGAHWPAGGAGWVHADAAARREAWRACWARGGGADALGWGAGRPGRKGAGLFPFLLFFYFVLEFQMPLYSKP